MKMSSNNKPSLLRPNSSTKLNLSKPEGLKGSSVSMLQVKREPLAADSKLFTTERLSSFRLPRDLTLGGTSLPIARPNLSQNANKRVYTPNLNAIRNKNV